MSGTQDPTPKAWGSRAIRSVWAKAREKQKTFLYWGGLAVVVLALGQIAMFQSHGRPLKLKLSRGEITVFDFPSKKPRTTALILFASGDGGWGRLEETICHAMQKKGCEVIGIDSTEYAQNDYDLATLQADFRMIASKAAADGGLHALPLIVGGYSMGAAQAIAVAGGPNPPRDLVGLLVVDPLSRGRYGLRTEDQMNVLPVGSGTFGVEDFTKTMGKLRVVQWHAEKDTIDSRDWLGALTAEHREFDFPGAGHEYKEDRSRFVRELADSVDWLLQSPQAGRVVTGGARG